jgi:hypothetical protein
MTESRPLHHQSEIWRLGGGSSNVTRGKRMPKVRYMREKVLVCWKRWSLCQATSVANERFWLCDNFPSVQQALQLALFLLLLLHPFCLQLLPLLLRRIQNAACFIFASVLRSIRCLRLIGLFSQTSLRVSSVFPSTSASNMRMSPSPSQMIMAKASSTVMCPSSWQSVVSS